jgi:hypothetical protein
MTTLIDNRPNASKLMDSLRSTGYNNYGAIADLIDNSFDAHASNVWVNVGTTNQDDIIIKIADNGDGMSEETLIEAMRLGSNLPKNFQSDLGRYGMGLITASISMGKKLAVITKQYGQTLVAVQDLEKIRELDDFKIELRRPSETESNVFIESSNASSHGTVVIISNVDHFNNRNLSAFRDTLSNKLGETFREFINAGKKIEINGKEVKAYDPLARDNPETEVLVEDVYNMPSGGSIRLTIVRLPRITETQNKNLKNFQTQNIPNQGIYLLRNSRQIARGEQLNGLFTKHNSLNRFRAELVFTGDADETLGIKFTKDGVEEELPDDIRSWLYSRINPQTQMISKTAKKEKIRLTVEKDVHKKSAESIKIKAKLLPDLRLYTDKNIDVAVTSQNVIERKLWRDRHEAECHFDTVAHGRFSEVFDYELKNRKVVITYNTDHPFYEKVFVENEDNVELVNTIDSFIYSLVSGIVSIRDDKIEDRVVEFMHNVSDSLRILLT